VKLRMLVPFFLLTACATSGNDAAEPGLSMSASPTTVSPGGSVTLTLSNQTAWPVGYNLCTSALQREAAGSWQAVPEDRICTMELRMLDPGGRSQLELQLPPTLEPGQYRYTANIEDRGSMEEVSTEPFTVR
jgi:hypothetical protein